MKRHLYRKIKCPRNLESYKYNENELIDLSLLPDKKLKDEFKKNKDILPEIDLDTIKTLDELLAFIAKYKKKKCMFCSVEYSRIFDLKRHVKGSCKNILIDVNKNLSKIVKNESNIEDKTYIQNNIINNINAQQINNITINVYNDNNTNKTVIVPFDQKWDVSNFDDNQKLLMLLQDIKFSNTLEKILENEKNQNVIIDKNNNSGLVYKNEDDKFTNMKTNDIIDKAMYKIYNHLLDFYTEMKNKKYNYSNLHEQKKNIEKKYEDYKNETTKGFVKNILIDIFDKNKEKVIERFLQFNSNENGIKSII